MSAGLTSVIADVAEDISCLASLIMLRMSSSIFITPVRSDALLDVLDSPEQALMIFLGTFFR